MDLATIPAPAAPAPVPVVPGWALPGGPVTDPAEAAFLAGAALTSLDNLVRSNPPWAGAWRARLALSCAAAAARHAGRTEDEAALRDAWVLRSPDGDPGPAGRLLAAWRRLAERSPGADATTLQSTCALLGIGWSADLAAVPEAIDRLVGEGRPAPLIAAAVLRAIDKAAPSAGLLGWWLADQVLARRLRWPLPMPLLIVEAHSAAFRGPGRGGRLRPAEEGFEVAVCLAVAQGAARALRCAAEIAPRAARLHAVAPKLRAKGAGEAIARLFGDDAVPGTLATAKLSRWGARRLFERLETLGAVRELTGRSAFRLYGL
ncbi:MAG: hypothetical protein B7Y12_15750 [Rhizobiales bacterium 24-66-13]|jgi:hypothetical protein|nr:MAG: hypothetical protein B7Z41_01025 [Rhizobiales bacterium 12-66-7]OYX66437.1 MAG: hypothetical protein B7Y95_23725 [Rhizobiales bacterium 32-66-11]OYY86636.1 MAG: hypothetical protein B7Y61_06245 [Rhizobiales bacterium 35-66-30]OYZ72342.1 MAG: hypothetical protein B7Y12_15750 [Rhizobiales bacterium 24-66-13]OZB05278.1 MAG: hypothetical protein B7X67_12370 [Rhizobiales bacterium 39-66-18]HQS11177.1 DUF1403 family protein [Xanthobacteraceae bacterium]